MILPHADTDASPPAPPRRSFGSAVRGTLSSERGVLSTELAVVAPFVLVAFVLLVVYAGRTAQTENDVRSAAHEAARAATLEGDPSSAATVARQIAASNLAESGVACAHGVTVDVDTSNWAPGGWVEVTVACQTSFADLAELEVPATRTFVATASEVIDVYRENQ